MRNKKKKVDLNLSFLKNIPAGRHLYSIPYGDVIINTLNGDPKFIQIQVSLFTTVDLDFDGKVREQGECILFPSKDHKTWKNWQYYLIKKGDFVVSDSGHTYYVLSVFKDEILVASSFPVEGYFSESGDEFTGGIAGWADETQVEKFKSELKKNGFEIQDGKISKLELTPKPDPTFKFKVGDWITNGTKTYHISDLKDGRYICDETDADLLPRYVDEHYHLWTIKDAKLGDILVTTEDNHPFMFRKLIDDTLPDATCGIDSCGNFKVCEDDGNWWTDRIYCPATEDQKIELYRKMHDAGYYWDLKNLELIKLENKIDHNYFLDHYDLGLILNLNNIENVMLLQVESDRIKVITEDGVIKSMFYNQINHVYCVNSRFNVNNFRMSLRSHNYVWDSSLQTLDCLIKPGDLVIGGNGEVYYVDNIDDLMYVIKVKELRLRDSSPYPPEIDTLLIRNCDRVIHTSKLNQL